MCGRYCIKTTKSEIAKEFKCNRVDFQGANYNVAPSQTITVVKKSIENNEAVLMQWGLIPRWVKNLEKWKANIINARVETVAEKPSFSNAFANHPCLIPITGFYEWDSDKQPYFFYEKNHPFALAGIWDIWETAEKSIISCTILTTQAKGAIADIHQRMPVIIRPEHYDLWLGELEERKALLESLDEPELQSHAVSRAVNSPRNNNADLMNPIG